MAGLGSRFSKAGYATPKPFIRFGGKPMISHVIENLYIPDARYILIAQNAHMEQEPDTVKEILANYPSCFIGIDGTTEGAACTVLFARRLIDSETPVVIANSDQLVEIDFKDYVEDATRRKLDGSIMTFAEPGRDPKWSYAAINEHGYVTDVKEKVAVSDYATVGIYHFGSGAHYVDAALQMILENNRSNNEFYVCPVYSYSIAEGKKIGIYNIDSAKMHGLGTPDDLQAYLKRYQIAA